MIPALLVFLFPLAYSPGPGNLFFAAAGSAGLQHYPECPLCSTS